MQWVVCGSVIYKYITPISLYVTLEMQKFQVQKTWWVVCGIVIYKYIIPILLYVTLEMQKFLVQKTQWVVCSGVLGLHPDLALRHFGNAKVHHNF